MDVRLVCKDTNVETSVDSSALSLMGVDNQGERKHVCGEVCTSVFVCSELSSMSKSSKLPSAATGFAFLLLGFSMRSSRLITCREPIVALVLICKSLCTEESK